MALEDSIRAYKIYRANIAAPKGKTTRTKPYPVVTDYVTFPREIIKINKNITISGDILFFNKIKLFETIIHTLNIPTSSESEK